MPPIVSEVVVVAAVVKVRLFIGFRRSVGITGTSEIATSDTPRLLMSIMSKVFHLKDNVYVNRTPTTYLELIIGVPATLRTLAMLSISRRNTKLLQFMNRRLFLTPEREVLLALLKVSGLSLAILLNGRAPYMLMSQVCYFCSRCLKAAKRWFFSVANNVPANDRVTCDMNPTGNRRLCVSFSFNNFRYDHTSPSRICASWSL
nr:hypothetical protein [Tanacetum cinerariifolium]